MRTVISLLLALAPLTAAAQQAPSVATLAISTDPVRDARHSAGMEVLHIPSAGVEMNGVAYVPAGTGPHPVLLILHGLPGNEKNLDVAQSARRAGWVAVTMNYRGAWGSPGTFSFANVLADVQAALVHLRTPAVARRLRADPDRIVLAGHSMGGWATALTAARDPALAGAVLISAADMGAQGATPRDKLVAGMAENRETLTATAAAMADELIAKRDAFALAGAARGLARVPLLVLSSDDGLAPGTDRLAAAVQAAGSKKVDRRHIATDHGWSDRRIALQTLVIDWIAALR